jgi:hypothetical protein
MYASVSSYLESGSPPLLFCSSLQPQHQATFESSKDTSVSAIPSSERSL